ncbi:MAG: O-antigen ligase family protein [Ornithinimicrobium sp.]
MSAPAAHADARPELLPRMPWRVGPDAGTRHTGVPRGVRICLIVALSLLPLLQPAGPANTSIVDLAIGVLVLAVGWWAWQTRRLTHLPYLLGMGLMMLAGAFAAWRAEVGSGGLVLLQDGSVLLWGAAITMVALAGVGARALLLRAFCWSGTAWAGVLVLGRVTGVDTLAGITAADGKRASLTFGDPNLAANYFLTVIFLLAASRAIPRLWLRVPAMLLVLTAIVLTGSNGGMLGLIGGALVAVPLGVGRVRGALAGVGVAAGLGLTVVLLGPHVSLSGLTDGSASQAQVIRDSVGRSDQSSESREALWREELRLWGTSDLVGVGPAQTRSVLRTSGAPYVKEAHTDYLGTLVERGLLGGIGLIVLMVTVATRASRVRADRLVPRPELIAGLLVAMAISAVFYEVLHFRHLWFVLGLVAGLDAALQRQPVAHWLTPQKRRVPRRRRWPR